MTAKERQTEYRIRQQARRELRRAEKVAYAAAVEVKCDEIKAAS